MAESLKDDATLELGRSLTRELGLDDSVDTLGRWMAHYLAELMREAEEASPEERPVKMRSCHEAILDLWSHRYVLPTGKRPFEDLEPILRALESLDPEAGIPRYFRPIRVAADATEDNDAQGWLNRIDGIDYSARLLIRYFLAQASHDAIDKSAEWVEMASAAGMDEVWEAPVFRMIADEKAIFERPSEEEIVRRQMQERITRLEGFSETARALAAQMRESMTGGTSG